VGVDWVAVLICQQLVLLRGGGVVREKFAVRLTPEERSQLEHMVRAGKSSARVINRDRILLKTGEGWPAPRVAQALDVSQGTVFNVKRRFAEGGLEGVLKDRPQTHRYRKMDDRAEGHLITLACSPAPEGHEHWNLRLLADRMVEMGVVESLSYETVRLHLKKTRPSRGGRNSGAFPR